MLVSRGRLTSRDWSRFRSKDSNTVSLRIDWDRPRCPGIYYLKSLILVDQGLVTMAKTQGIDRLTFSVLIDSSVPRSIILLVSSVVLFGIGLDFSCPALSLPNLYSSFRTENSS